MKRMLLIMLIFLNFIKVEALEYGDWTDELNDDNSEIVSSEVRYRWYKNVKVDSPDYYIEGENNLLYPNINYEDVKVTDWSSWSDIIPLPKVGRTIIDKETKRYRTLRKVRYLFIDNLHSFTSITRIAEINALIDNIEVQATMTCTNCSSSFNEFANDHFLDGESYINDGGTITIDLGNYYDIGKIALEIYMYDTVGDTKNFSVYYNEGNTLTDRNYAYRDVMVYVGQNEYYNSERFYVIPYEWSITNPVYNDWIYTDDNVDETYYRQVQDVNLYCYKDTLYRYYKTDRSYLDGYYSNVEDTAYVKDVESAKTYYIYKEIITNDDNKNEVDTPDANDDIDDTAGQDNNDATDIEQGNNRINDTARQEVGATNDNLKIEKVVDRTSKVSIKANAESVITKKENKNVNDQIVDNIDSSLENIVLDDSKKFIKEESKKNNIVNILNKSDYKLIFMYCFLVIGLLIVLFKLRYHILSHQN